MVRTPQDYTRQLFNRLRYIEGQAQGIRRMLISGRTGADVLVQLRAIESAASGARELYLRQLAEEDLREEWRQQILGHLSHCEDAADLLALLEGGVEEAAAGQRSRRRRDRERPEAEQSAG